MITRAVEYGVAALCLLTTARGKPLLVKEIAATCQLPTAYLAKVMHALSKAGLVVAHKGVTGGMMLARGAEQITMHDICVALGDPVVRERPIDEIERCPNAMARRCSRFWVTQNREWVDFLRRATIAEIAAFEPDAGSSPGMRALAAGGVEPGRQPRAPAASENPERAEGHH